MHTIQLKIEFNISAIAILPNLERNGTMGNTKHFYPKPGYVAMKVNDDAKELWASKKHHAGLFDGYDDRCFSCIIYKHGDKKVLEVIVVEGVSRWYKYFEKVNGETWTSVNRDVFLNKLKEIVTGSG